MPVRMLLSVLMLPLQSVVSMFQDLGVSLEDEYLYGKTLFTRRDEIIKADNAIHVLIINALLMLQKNLLTFWK